MKETRLKTGILETLETLPTKQHKPIPFWSINSKLEKAEIIRQIEEMYSYGLGGFVFHARTGLVTEYLSEEWFEMVEASLDTAKRLGMDVWIYDENGWPSGFVGGKLLEKPENRATFLRYAVLDEYDENAYAVYEYTEEKGARWLKEKEEIEGKYHTVYKLQSDAYTDILNPEVTKQFIAETYEKYYERYSDRFGKELVGFFTDEPQYYRYETPISSVAETEYKKTYHKELKEGLLYLFLQDERGYPFRVEYYNLLNRLYCENFYKMLMDWCEEKGCLLTGHSVEETSLHMQMWGGADCASSYLYEHIPAIDNLAKDSTAEISAKSVGSVAMQCGKQKVFTETFGVSGYSVTPKQLKLIGDKQYVYGVNMMIQHLYNYSLAGQGKIDCPPSFGRAMPWISGYPEFNGYFEKLGYLIANSEEFAPVAVITPMESVYLDYIRLDESESQKKVDAPFMETLTALRKAGIAYHFVNEKVLEKLGKTENGRLVVGERSYQAVVLANCREIKSNTLSLLHKYLDNGGKLCVMGDAPEYADGLPVRSDLNGNCTVKELPRPLNLRSDGVFSYTYRAFGDKKFLFIVNENDLPVRVETEIPFSLLDLAGNKGYRALNSHMVPAKGSVLLEEQGEYEEEYPVYEKTATMTPKFLSSDKNNLTIEWVTVELDNGESLTGYIYGVFETLIKRGYASRAHVKFLFESDKQRSIVITHEKQDVKNLRFNGEILSFKQSSEDVNFEYAETYANVGENVYEYDVNFGALRAATEILYKKGVPESLLNCTTYHTGMEQIYIAGDFDVDGFTLREPAQKQAGDLSQQGYSNFYGAVRYEITLDKDIKQGYIKPVGDYTQCIVTAGGKKYRCMLEEGVRVQDVPAGKVEIECYSTLRNRIGPFHFAAPVDDGVGPDCFTMRNLWENEKGNKYFYAPKRVVPFGLERVEIEYIGEKE